MMNPDQPEVVAPQPVPFNVIVSRAPAPQAPEGFCVVMQTFSPTGQHVMFFPAELAKEVARQLTEHATGLTLPDLRIPGMN